MVTVDHEKHEVELLLLTRKDSGFSRFGDFRGKVLALPAVTAQFSALYRVWMESMVMKEGGASASPMQFFSKVQEARNASLAIMAVFFHKANCCVVSGRAYKIATELNPQIARELKVVSHVGKLIGGIIAQRSDLSPDLKQKALRALMTLHEEQEGRQMFALFQLSRLTLYQPEYLKGTEALYSEHRILRSRIARR